MYLHLITGILIGLVVGIAGLFIVIRRRFRVQYENQRQHLAVESREARLALREEKAELEFKLKNQTADLHSAQRDQARQAERIQVDVGQIELKSKDIARQQRVLEDAEHEAAESQRLYRLKLHQLTQLDAAQARELLMKAAENECAQEIREFRYAQLERSELEIADEAKRVLLAAMQRISSQPMNDATATIVNLPSEEMKGRIIGREGRNIRTFEHATGTTLMIDETPDSVLISCFDPVRREIARLALEALLRDGRIHPASIEEGVIVAEAEMHANVIDLGEAALRKLRLSDVHPDVVVLLGKLHYRLSNNQNTLAHSVEVGNLCALMASELGLDPMIAKRAGLFHDIGKALDEEYQGSHAKAGAELIKQHGEDPRVVNATAAHHKEVPAESAYAGIVMVADSLSAVRPGARTSSIDGFIQRGA